MIKKITRNILCRAYNNQKWYFSAPIIGSVFYAWHFNLCHPDEEQFTFDEVVQKIWEDEKWRIQ